MIRDRRDQLVAVDSAAHLVALLAYPVDLDLQASHQAVRQLVCLYQVYYCSYVSSPCEIDNLLLLDLTP